MNPARWLKPTQDRASSRPLPRRKQDDPAAAFGLAINCEASGGISKRSGELERSVSACATARTVSFRTPHPARNMPSPTREMVKTLRLTSPPRQSGAKFTRLYDLEPCDFALFCLVCWLGSDKF